MNLIATVTFTMQNGVDIFTNYRESKLFNGESTISEIIEWANSFGQSKVFNDIEFSNFHDLDKVSGNELIPGTLDALNSLSIRKG